MERRWFAKRSTMNCSWRYFIFAERFGFYAPDIPSHVKRDGFWSNIKTQSIQVSRSCYIILFSLSLSPCMYYELYIYIYLHVKIYYYHMYIYSTYNRPHARASTMTTPSIQVTWTEPVGVQTSEFEQNTLGTWWKLCGRGAENQPPMCCTYFPPQTIQLKKPEHHSFKWKGTIIWSKSFRTFAVNNANFTVLPLDTGFRKENMVNFMAGTFNARLPWNRAHLSWVPAFIARELRGRRWNN